MTAATVRRTRSNTPAKKTLPKPIAPRALPRLRAWVAGSPTGINHSYSGFGKQRHLTPAAQSWGQAVVFAVTKAARDAGLSQLAPAEWGEALAVRMHFYVAATRFKTGRVRKLDIDAPVKHTLDRAMEALGLDDQIVASLDVIQTVLDEAPRPGGYGPTRQGCWIDISRLSTPAIRRLNSELPGGGAL